MAPPVRTTTFARGTFSRGSGGLEDTGRTMEAVTNGFDQFVNNLKTLSKEIAQKAGEKIVEKTDPLVPVQYEGLKESSQVIVEKGNDGYRARVSYGGPTRKGPTPNAPAGIVNYAVLVHETNMPHPRGGQWKYLQTGARLAIPDIQKIIEEEARKAVGRRGKRTQ